MAGHVDLRNHFNMPFRGIDDDFTDFILRIEPGGSVRIGIAADAADRTEFGIGLDFDPPALIVRKVPVESVQFIACHEVKDFLYLLLAVEVSGLVQHESSPRVARCVLDDAAVHHIGLGKLLQRLLRVESSRIVRRLDHDPVLLYLKLVCLRGEVLRLDILDPAKVLFIKRFF